MRMWAARSRAIKARSDCQLREQATNSSSSDTASHKKSIIAHIIQPSNNNSTCIRNNNKIVIFQGQSLRKKLFLSEKNAESTEKKKSSECLVDQLQLHFNGAVQVMCHADVKRVAETQQATITSFANLFERELESPTPASRRWNVWSNLNEM